MPSKLKKAIAAVKDQTSISLAKVASKDSSNLEVAVLKATSHEDVPVDEKYVNEVLRLVAANKANAQTCARAIGKRIGRTRNWVVALKSLMLVLRIFQDGDPYFPREVVHAMKRGAKILNLASFRDDSNSSPWDFTSFIRTFALYLDERLECFLTGKLQRREALGGPASIYQRSKSKIKPFEPVKDMKPSMLLDKMSYWQRLLDRAIATRPTGSAKSNRLVHVALYAILQESFDLYRDISEGLSLILDSFFHLQYQNCVIAFQTCMKAVKQSEEVSSFFSLCKSLGVGRISEYPSMQVISEELIESLQEFLKDQSSFQSSNSLKPVVVNQVAAPAPALIVRTRSVRKDSYGGQSDFSVTTDGYSDDGSEIESQGASLEELISAAGTWKSPAISIDLEAYNSSFKPDDAFGVSDTGSSRSLPVTSSADMMSLDDWSSEEDDDEEDEDRYRRRIAEKRKAKFASLSSKNWETVLAETASSLSTPTPLSVNNANTFCAFPETSPAASESSSAVPSSWDTVSFAAAGTPLTPPDAQTPVFQHYNPFLADLPELPGELNQQSAAAAPTFQATPTFSAQNPEVNSSEDDPFASWTAFDDEPVGGGGGGVDQQNLQQQQQLWLQNQNKILEKNWS